MTTYCGLKGFQETLPDSYLIVTRKTIHYKTPRHFLIDKIICEHFYELVITIACTFNSFKHSIHCQLEFIVCPSLFCLFITHHMQNFRLHAYIFVLSPCFLSKLF